MVKPSVLDKNRVRVIFNDINNDLSIEAKKKQE